MKRIKKYLGGSYFRLPSLSSEFLTGAALKVPYINTLLQQYITNTGNFSAPIPTSSKVKDNTLKDTVSNIGSSIIGKASDAVSDKIFGDSELGRNLGTIFSSGLNSVGDTVLNNAIKKAALTDGLTKNLGSSVGGAVAGLGANYLGRGITSILGNNAASRFLGLSASTVGGTIGGKILSSGTKNLFSGPGSINPIGLGMSAVGAGLSAATGPSKEYNGTYGSTTKALDTVYDALLAGISFVPGWGLIASGAMALNKGLSNIFGSTDGMTTLDAILGSAFMPAPIKWLNMLGSSKTGTFNKLSWQNTLKTSNFMQNAFGDLEDKFSKAREEAGKTYGTFSQGAKKRALDNIDFSNFAWNKILNMADQNEYQNIRSSDMASINNLRYALWILGGFSPLARGKNGMKIFNNSINHNLGLRLLSGAALIDNKQMILSALNGTKIKKKGIKSGINVDYYDPDNVMSVVANNPDKTIVLDEMTVRPYNKLPMQSELFQGITNQAANERADEYVNRVTPTAEDLFNIGTLGGLNNLSPTQWARRAYNLRKAIKGNMSWNKFGNNWFYGNNGLVSDKYAQEHPYASAAINLAGDIGAFGTFSALRKLPKYATLMEAENRAAQEATALNWRDMLSNNVKRTRIGDVEIDNPNLLYHLDRGNSAGMFSNQGAYVEDGILFPGVAKKEGQLGYSWWNKGKPYTTSVKGQPMTRLMTATKDIPGMLQVRSQNYPIGQWTGSKGFVLPSEYVNPEGVNVSESIYALEPTYGWRRVSENTPTLNWPDAVTFDNNGVRIPLGKRDNFKLNDIRYGWQGNRYVLDLTTLEGILNFIDNDIIPRMLAQGHDVSSYTPIFRQFSPKTDAFDEAMSKANSGSGAWFTPASNDITIRGPLEKQDFGLTIHEAGGHGLRYNMLPDYVPTKREYLNEYIITGGRDMSDEAANALLKMHTGDQIYNIIEAQKLRESYPWIKTYFERNPVKKSGDTVLRESGSVNTQFRSHYSNSGKIVGKELDKAIDEASPGVVLRDLIEQPYTSSIIDDIGKITGKDPDVLLFYGPEMLEKLVNLYPELLKIVSKVKDTMKTVGSYGVPVTIGGSTAATLYNKSK